MLASAIAALVLAAHPTIPGRIAAIDPSGGVHIRADDGIWIARAQCDTSDPIDSAEQCPPAGALAWQGDSLWIACPDGQLIVVNGDVVTSDLRSDAITALTISHHRVMGATVSGRIVPDLGSEPHRQLPARMTDSVHALVQLTAGLWIATSARLLLRTDSIATVDVTLEVCALAQLDGDLLIAGPTGLHLRRHGQNIAVNAEPAASVTVGARAIWLALADGEILRLSKNVLSNATLSRRRAVLPVRRFDVSMLERARLSRWLPRLSIAVTVSNRRRRQWITSGLLGMDPDTADTPTTAAASLERRVTEAWIVLSWDLARPPPSGILRGALQ